MNNYSFYLNIDSNVIPQSSNTKISLPSDLAGIATTAFQFSYIFGLRFYNFAAESDHHKIVNYFSTTQSLIDIIVISSYNEIF